jgi:hypothetical protein
VACRLSGNAASRGAPSHLDAAGRPAVSIERKLGVLTLRGCMIFAIIVIAFKLIQVLTAHH